MYTVHETADLVDAWDYQVSQLSYAVNCARSSGWAPNYGIGQRDAAGAWLDEYNGATADYVVVRQRVKNLVDKLAADGSDWDKNGAYDSTGDLWAAVLQSVAPFADLDRQLRYAGNPTGFPHQCLPTYPHVPQPQAPDWDLNLYKEITSLPGMGPGQPWYRPFVIAAEVIAGAAVVVGGVYLIREIARR